MPSIPMNFLLPPDMRNELATITPSKIISNVISIFKTRLSAIDDAVADRIIRSDSKNTPEQYINLLSLLPSSVPWILGTHASKTAMIPERNTPSNVPAPPIEATGAPSPFMTLRFVISAPMRVPSTPLTYANANTLTLGN